MKFFPLFLILFLTATAFSQVSLKQGPKVNGIGLGATREEVIRKFGKPLSQTKRDAGECVGGTEMTLRYPGLKFTLYDEPENRKKFTVGEFEVTSAKWDVSGARIGQSSTAIRKLFGTRSSEETESGSLIWYYEMDEESPGFTNFHFRNGSTIKIVSGWLMC